jgi:nickel/cobalt transporter (NicO) family protein
MSGSTPALLAAAAGVGFGHAVLPDHWVPLAVLGRTRRYPLSRVARLSGMAGVAHVLVSIALGAVIVAIGLQFRSAIQSTQDTIVGGVLIATGIALVVVELTGHGHGRGHGHDHGHAPYHHHHHDGHEPDGDTQSRAHGSSSRSRFHGLAAVVVPFGAAASPDLTILPVFLAAATVGIATAIGSILIFAGVTIGTIVGLTVAAACGGYQFRGRWLERWGNVLTAIVLAVIGLLVLVGAI